MVITEAVRLDVTFTTNPNLNILGTRVAMNNNSHRPITSRANKAPIYTSDKRAKFAQRENKKWVRLATVVGYLISVCIPAIALSVYYVGFWDPDYKTKISNDSMHKMDAVQVIKIEPATDSPDDPNKDVKLTLTCPRCECKNDKENEKKSIDKKIRNTDLGSLLSGSGYRTLSSNDDSSASPMDFDDYQASFGSHEETFTYGQPLNVQKKIR